MRKKKILNPIGLGIKQSIQWTCIIYIVLTFWNASPSSCGVVLSYVLHSTWNNIDPTSVSPTLNMPPCWNATIPRSTWNPSGLPWQGGSTSPATGRGTHPVHVGLRPVSVGAAQRWSSRLRTAAPSSLHHSMVRRKTCSLFERKQDDSTDDRIAAIHLLG